MSENSFEDMGTEDSTAIMLSDLMPNDETKTRIRYDYDFGDSWDHEVLFERRIEPDAGQTYPVCVGGARACPPEDVGGIWSYAEFVAAIGDKKHKQHKELLEWCGGSFDPEEFDADVATGQMKRGVFDWRSMF